jgi:hypothetical protein
MGWNAMQYNCNPLTYTSGLIHNDSISGVMKDYLNCPLPLIVMRNILLK